MPQALNLKPSPALPSEQTSPPKHPSTQTSPSSSKPSPSSSKPSPSATNINKTSGSPSSPTKSTSKVHVSTPEQEDKDKEKEKDGDEYAHDTLGQAGIRFKSEKQVVQEAISRADDKYYDPMSANIEVAHVGMTRRDKEMFYTTVFIMDRLKDLRMDELFELNKWVLFFGTVISSIIGACLIMCGLSYSIFFEEVKKSYYVVGIGAVFLLPAAVWVKFWVFPGKVEADSRKQVIKNRELMGDEGIGDALSGAQKEFSRPPTKRIPCYFILRKRRYKVIASNMRELCELIQKESGIPMSQQMMKYNGPSPCPLKSTLNKDVALITIGEYFDIHVDWRLVEDYRFLAGFEVIVYNRGVWETECEQNRLKMDKKHSVHAKIEVVTKEERPLNAVEQLQSSISQDLVDELHREVEACSTYEEAAAIGATRIKSGVPALVTPAQLSIRQDMTKKIERNKVIKAYTTKDPLSLEYMEKRGINHNFHEFKLEDIQDALYDGKKNTSPSRKEDMQKYLQGSKGPGDRDDDGDEDDDDDDDALSKLRELPV